MSQKYDVAAYVWPSYTGDEPRTRMFWPEGYGEWQTVKSAQKKFPEHSWPRKPLWGYVNEANSAVMEMQIDAAADHGVNVFIYDWYWYDGRPFLENCLNYGYLKARNNHRVKFYLMWANHTVNHLWDTRLAGPGDNGFIWDGAVDRKQFEIIAKRVIENYFKHPSYYKIDGKPVFSIFDLHNLLRGLGGATATREAFDWFRAAVMEAGFPGVHLQMILTGAQTYQTGTAGEMIHTPTREVVETLGFDSLTHYQFCMFTKMARDYREVLVDVQQEWKRLEKTHRATYFPHVSVGWDTNPRFRHDLDPNIVKNNTPKNVKAAFQMARDYADAHPAQKPLITVNSWNEWTETSYLQPDDLYGYGYLQALKEVFA